MTRTPISAEDFEGMFRGYQDAFRLEWQEYPLTFEQDIYAQYLAGFQPLPSEWPDWRGWLDHVMVMTAHGSTVSRVSLLSDPPTRYQQLRISCAGWHRGAGENLLFLPCSAAADLGIPAGNWWLFDNEQAVIMTFTGTGGVGGTTLVTGPEVAVYRRWCDLATSTATAETITV